MTYLKCSNNDVSKSSEIQVSISDLYFQRFIVFAKAKEHILRMRILTNQRSY